MNDIATYWTNQSTETVHLAPQSAWASYHKTFCGRAVEGLVPGDETVTGVTATCSTCKTNFKKSKETTQS